MAPTLSRRRVLRALGAAPAAATVGRVPAWPATRETTILTRNLGLGAGLVNLFTDDSVPPRAVYAKFDAVRDSGVPARMAAIADEIAAERPAVVGLQEAAVVRRGPPGGTADALVVDFLDGLLSSLSDPTYRPAVASENADVSLPAESPDGERFTVRLIDRDAVLVRGDVPVEATATHDYSLNARTTRDGRVVTATRGYCHADVSLAGVACRAVSTHLEPASEIVRRAQAAELVAAYETYSGPVVLLGDFNAGPAAGAGSAYDSLTGPFTDAWGALARGEGPTCCQLPGLNNVRSRLDERVDLVLVGGPVEPLDAHRVGETRDARVDVGERTRWVSDHAGVVARLRIAPPLSDPRAVVGAVL